MLHRAIVLLMLAASLGLVAVGCNDHGDAAHSDGHTSTATADIVTVDSDPQGDWAGAEVTMPQQAPDFGTLRNSLGQRVSIADLRGKAVLVTFVYSNCPDVCPLIMSNIRRAMDMLGPKADDLRVVAVSVDPEGDTAAAVNAYLEKMRLKGRVDWLVGTEPELHAVWDAWGIATRIPRDQPELVEHTAPIFGISASGMVEVIYGVQVKAAELSADIPKLQAL